MNQKDVRNYNTFSDDTFDYQINQPNNYKPVEVSVYKEKSSDQENK